MIRSRPVVVALAALLASGACRHPSAGGAGVAAAPAPAAEASAAEQLEGALVVYQNGREIGRETYRQTDQMLESVVLLGPARVRLKLPLAGGRITAECNGTPVVREPPAGALVLENGSWQSYALAARQVEAAGGGPVKVYLPCAGVSVDGQARATREADGSLRVEVTIGAVKVEAHVAPDGRVARAAVPVQALIVRLEGEPAPSAVRRAPPPAPPGTRAEEVEVLRGGVAVRGTLLVPEGVARPPVVLLIAGSGPTDRDCNNAMGLLRTDAFRLIAEGLAAQGVATLRYDKRGIGKSGTNFPLEKVVLQDFVKDAQALVGWLRETGRFARVVVAGHSEGALIGMLLARAEPVDGLALLAGGGRPLAAILREQLARQLDAEGLAELDRGLATLREGRSPEPAQPLLKSVFAPAVQPFLRSILDVDPAALLPGVPAPVLIVQGERDLQISVQDARLLAQARPDAKLVLLAKASHVFKDDAPQMPQASYTDPSLPLSEGLVAALAAFARG